MIGSNIFCTSVNSFITWSKVNPSLPSLIHFSFSVASNNLNPTSLALSLFLESKVNKLFSDSLFFSYSFRHSCASLLINTGEPPTTVSKYLGHASTKETLDTYAHMFPNNLGDVKNTIDNLNLGI